MSVNPNTAASQHELQARENGQMGAVDLKEFFQTCFKVGDLIEVAEAKKRQGRTGGVKITRGKIVQVNPNIITYHTGNYRLSVSLSDVLIRGYKVRKLEEANQPAEKAANNPVTPFASADAADIRYGEDLKALWQETGNVFDLAERLGVSSTRAELLLIQYGIIEGRLPKEERESEKAGEQAGGVAAASEAEAEVKVESGAGAETEAGTEYKAKPEPDAEAGPGPEVELDPELKSQPDELPETDQETVPIKTKKGFPARKAMPSREELLKAYQAGKNYSFVGRQFGVSNDLAKRWLILAGIIDAEMPKAYRDREKKKAEFKPESKAVSWAESKTESKKSQTGRPIENPAEGLAQIILINQDNQETILRRLVDLENILLDSEAREEAVYKAINAIENWAKSIDQAVKTINQILAGIDKQMQGLAPPAAAAPPVAAITNNLDRPLTEIELLAGILANVSLLLAGRGEGGAPHAG